MKKKAVVTGGAGFIGSHLAEELVKKGYHVTIIDDLSSGRINNLASLSQGDNWELIQGSITNPSLLQELFQGADYVFHQAAIPSVPRSVKNPLATHEINVTGTLNVLLAARDNKVKKLIYASSSSVYGDTPTLPKREDMIPSPLSPYAASKLAGEYYCRAFQEVYGLATVCLRYFNVYGPKQDPNSQYAAVIPLFIKLLLEDRAPVIFGDGHQTRDFTFVKDVVRANILAAESEVTGIFNVGGGKSTVINDLVHLVIRIMGRNLEPIYQSPRPGDVRHSLADISKARAIGFEPQYSLKDGLKETIRSFQHET